MQPPVSHYATPRYRRTIHCALSIDRGESAILAATGAVLLAAIVAVIAFHLDISAARDFNGDAVVRDSRAPAEIPFRRYADSSPSSIWLPSDWHVWDSIRGGTLPLWDRLQGGGYSPLVTLQNGVFHPVRWLVAALPRSAAPSVLILIAFAIAFSGMFMAARDFGTTLIGASVAAFVYTFGTVSVSFAQFSGAILPISHLPWLIFAYRRALRGHSILPGAVVSALIFMSGHPLIVFVVGLAFIAVVVADAVAQRKLQPLIMATFLGSAGVVLAAFALVPALIGASDSWTYKNTSIAGTPYRALPMRLWLNAVHFVVFDEYETGSCCIDLPRFYLFQGLPMIALVVTGCVASLWKKRGRGVAFFALLFALLALPGPWMAPIAHLKPIAYLKPWYLLPAFAFFAALAVSSGVSLAIDSKRNVLRIGIAIVVVCVAVLDAQRAFGVLSPRPWRDVARSDVLSFLRRGGEFRITGLWGETHIPNSSRITGLEDVRIAGPLIPIRYALWWQAVDSRVASLSYPTVRITDRLDSALVSDFNIAYVLQGRLPYIWTFYTIDDPARRDAMLSPLLRNDTFPLVLRTPSLEVRRPASPVRPRAHFADNVQCVSNVLEAAKLLGTQRDLARTTAIVECLTPTTFAAGGTGRVIELSYPDERHVRSRVYSDRGGLFVLHDTFAPGWSARVDGNMTRVYAVNILSRGVVVPAGEHTIVMSYLPPGFVAGVIVSILALITLLVTGRRIGKLLKIELQV